VPHLGNPDSVPIHLPLPTLADMTQRPLMLSWLALACSAALSATPDPPARAGRLSHVNGEVTLQAEGARHSDRARLNWPLTSGDGIVTGRAARAEISFGTVAVRLDSDTRVSLVEVGRAPLRLSIEGGAINMTVRDLRGEETVDVNTPRGRLYLSGPGEYRVAVLDDGAVRTAVLGGEARVETPVSVFQQLDGEQAGIAADGTVTLDRVSGAGNFDRWSQRRERRLAANRSALHVARGLVGYEDLDDFGTWHWEPDFGMVWTPKKIPADWAPYRHGEWILQEPWGWTWIDAAPWGFAPFHYGRWIQLRDRWHWLPGPRALPPVYAPALVRWLEHPTDRGLIGWRALGAFEEFRSRRLTGRYVGSLNVFARPGNVAAANLIQRDAVTWMPRSAFDDRAVAFRERMAQAAPLR
jgi:hypothetical protein